MRMTHKNGQKRLIPRKLLSLEHRTNNRNPTLSKGLNNNCQVTPFTKPEAVESTANLMIRHYCMSTHWVKTVSIFPRTFHGFMN